MGMMLDMALNLAEANPERIASALKKLPLKGAQRITAPAIQQALATGKQILSQSDNSAAGAKKAFSKLGIPPSFLDEAYSMVSPYISKIPGVSPERTKNAFQEIKSGMTSQETQSARTTPAPNQAAGFNRTKYPRVNIPKI